MKVSPSFWESNLSSHILKKMEDESLRQLWQFSPLSCPCISSLYSFPTPSTLPLTKKKKKKNLSFNYNFRNDFYSGHSQTDIFVPALKVKSYGVQ